MSEFVVKIFDAIKYPTLQKNKDPSTQISMDMQLFRIKRQDCYIKQFEYNRFSENVFKSIVI